MRQIFFITVLLLMKLVNAEIINVPDDHATIQSAINASVDSDTIIVSPGIYYENIDYSGKSILIASYYLLEQNPSYIENTIIDGGQADRVIILENSEGPGTSINGLTIQNGFADNGAGIRCIDINFQMSNMYIKNNHCTVDGGGFVSNSCDIQMNNCVFENNSAQDDGGGMHLGGSVVNISDCEIFNNYSTDRGGGINTGGETVLTVMRSSIHDNEVGNDGGGIYQMYSEGNFYDCIFYNNISAGGSAALDLWSSVGVIQNCTISNNISYSWAGGVGLYSTTTCEIINTIISSNEGSGIWGHSNSITDISYCNIYTNTEGDFGGYFAQGDLGVIQGQNYNGDPCDQYFNIYLDPEFLDPDNYNFQLTANSPCIDAGSPSLPPDEDGSISDIGALYFDPDYLYANFLVNVNEGVIPLTVEFTDISATGPSGDPIIAWEWDFDNDGTIDSSDQHPTFTYQEAGIYTVTLSVNDGENYDNCIKTDFITVHDPVEADFEANILEGYLPLEIQFNDLSVGLAQSWQWDFNNDGIIESIQQDPEFIFTQPGVYSVALTTQDGIYTDTEIKYSYITITAPLTANFTASPLQGVSPLEVQFTDISWGEPIFWIWDFNNDGFADSNEQNPIYIYNETGSYTVSLEISDGSEIVTEIKFDYIVVDPSEAENEVIPLRTELLGNYPNPFNPETVIQYQISEVSKVSLSIFNIKGQLIKTLVDDIEQFGEHSVVWSGKDDNNDLVNSGIYFYRLEVGSDTLTKRMVLLK